MSYYESSLIRGREIGREWKTLLSILEELEKMIRKTQPKQEKNMETEKKIDEEAVDIGDSLKSFIKKAERELEYCSLSEKDILVKLRVVDLLYVATKDAYELKGLPAKEALRHILGRIFHKRRDYPRFRLIPLFAKASTSSLWVTSPIKRRFVFIQEPSITCGTILKT